MGLFDNINSAVENAERRRQARRHISTDDQENIGMTVLANAAQSVHGAGHGALRFNQSTDLYFPC
jgi:hypothetical protein